MEYRKNRKEANKMKQTRISILVSTFVFDLVHMADEFLKDHYGWRTVGNPFKGDGAWNLTLVKEESDAQDYLDQLNQMINHIPHPKSQEEIPDFFEEDIGSSPYPVSEEAIAACMSPLTPLEQANSAVYMFTTMVALVSELEISDMDGEALKNAMIMMKRGASYEEIMEFLNKWGDE